MERRTKRSSHGRFLSLHGSLRHLRSQGLNVLYVEIWDWPSSTIVKDTSPLHTLDLNTGAHMQTSIMSLSHHEPCQQSEYEVWQGGKEGVQ